MAITVAGIAQGGEANVEIGCAGMPRRGSGHVTWRYVVEDRQVTGTCRSAGESFPGDRLSDQSDEVRDDSAVFVVMVVARALVGVACGILVHCLQTFLGVRRYLCVMPSSRTNTGAF